MVLCTFKYSMDFNFSIQSQILHEYKYTSYIGIYDSFPLFSILLIVYLFATLNCNQLQMRHSSNDRGHRDYIKTCMPLSCNHHCDVRLSICQCRPLINPQCEHVRNYRGAFQDGHTMATKWMC